MSPIRTSKVPPESLLGRYVAAGAYADCYVAELPQNVSHVQFVEAFYTSALFKVERFLLGLFISRPSTDSQARQLARGEVSSFAAWCVEARDKDQVLLAAGRTRSWLMVAVPPVAGTSGTLLFFGSAVVPTRSTLSGGGGMGTLFTALLGLHRLYSRALLHFARARLARLASTAPHGRGDDA